MSPSTLLVRLWVLRAGGSFQCPSTLGFTEGMFGSREAGAPKQLGQGMCKSQIPGPCPPRRQEGAQAGTHELHPVLPKLESTQAVPHPDKLTLKCRFRFSLSGWGTRF